MRTVRSLGRSHAWELREAESPEWGRVFVKTDATSGSAAVFAAEAAGLRWLGEAGAVGVAEVLEVTGERLVVSWVEAGVASARTAEGFGRGLARLHAAGAEGFGAPWAGFIARIPMDNRPVGAWAEFYAVRRLAPFVRAARDAGRLSARDAGVLDRVAERLPAVAGPAEPPARIHGDLWSGNVMWVADGAVLVDPAAHGGHRETDLAMLALFGLPRLGAVLAAYQEETPLADGWRERVPLHQLHPLLVHVCLYGGSYRDSLLDAAARVLAL
ncbi:fructosamine kinase family protein [Sphaerisporangium aureirubrum]|uniref:Fructosamine kinase family protein n=1 Tax=Sphaerisporangium aureirubrum TaxID=1544736 RepID=A0ABW1NR90_9ACTN